jgi:FixJ family two-component response regulator
MDTQGQTKIIAILDDDDSMRIALQGLLKAVGLPAQAFASAEEFVESGQQHKTACLIADIRMPGMSVEGAFALLGQVRSNTIGAQKKEREM